MDEPEYHSGTTKRLVVIIAGCVVISGSAIYYYFNYKNNQVAALFYILLVASVICVFYAFSPKNPARPNKLWQQNADDETTHSSVNSFGLLIGLAFIFGYGYLLGSFEKYREKSIMADGPTAVTTATITNIIIKTGRLDTKSYSAHLVYTANGQKIERDMPIDNGDLVAGQTCKVKYSVNYPEMFVIYGR